ncbi:hypothetical protein LEM8419_01113 [Neolewinella maritima]|uniref:SPOR domain-containing protein n=1 Tax=Neolewinella maritima TaxID=1383882 RepID=A0ABM9AZ76_9BACT|nr:S8 family serine peptidase [Neolewinella maritima]CAH0999819.1 hypothetical protein LEM8419_01113 [Neolewinella maritima]
MKEWTISSPAGRLHLHKSASLVGLKRDGSQESATASDAVLSELGGFELVRLPEAVDIDRALDDIRERDTVRVGTHVYTAGSDDRPVVPTGLIYCQLAPGVGEAESQRVFESLHLDTLERRADGTVVLSVTSRSRNPLHVASALEQLAMVQTTTPDIDVPLDQYYTAPRDGLFAEQWYLDNSGSVPNVPHFPLKPGADARIRAAWSRLGSLGSDRITIAVIDNGFDLEHPDLRGKASHALTVHSNQATVPRGSAYGDHGTPCASIALAPANSLGIVGAAPNARLMPLHGLTYSSYLTERMFSHCVSRGANIISCSWGTIDSRYRPGRYHELAVRKATTEGRGGKGCIVLFAAGNEGRDYLNYYCQLPGVIAVGASTSNDTHPAYSNRGRGLSVVAPSDGGWPVLAARASWDTGISGADGAKKYYVDGRDRGPHHKHFGGTSSATPLVAGICALMLSANSELTAAEVKAVLERTADKIGSPASYDASGYSEQFGYGRVNAERAVVEALRLRGLDTAPAAPPPLVELRVADRARSGYGLQIGAYRNQDGVVQLSKQLRQTLDLPVLISEEQGAGSTLYKLILGQFDTADEARAQLPRVRAAGYPGFVRELATVA